MSGQGWWVDVCAWRGRTDVTLRDRDWTVELNIDADGDLCIHADVEGNACDTEESIPMTAVIEFLRFSGYEVTKKEPTP